MMNNRDWTRERTVMEGHAGAERLSLIAGSYHRLIGQPLVPDGADVADALWNLPAVVLAHGTEEDPVFFYGNRAALTLFDFPAEEFIRLPSRYSAKPLARAERTHLLDAVSRQGFIADYSGVRTTRTGSLFEIAQAHVWNLLDQSGHLHGQAASFSQWTPLPA